MRAVVLTRKFIYLLSYAHSSLGIMLLLWSNHTAIREVNFRYGLAIVIKGKIFFCNSFMWYLIPVLERKGTGQYNLKPKQIFVLL